MSTIYTPITISLMVSLTLLSACTSLDSEEKYELKSPCVANEQAGSNTTPCVRRPVNAPHLG